MIRNFIILFFLILTFTLNAQINWEVGPSDQFIDCNDRGTIQENLSDYILTLSAATVDTNCDTIGISHNYIDDPLITCDTTFLVEIAAIDQCSNVLSESILVTIIDSRAPSWDWYYYYDSAPQEDIEILISNFEGDYIFPNGYFENRNHSWPRFPPVEGIDYYDNCNNVTFTMEGKRPNEIFPIGRYPIRYILDDGCNKTIHEFEVVVKLDTFCEMDICRESCETLPNCHLCNIYDTIEGVESCLPAQNSKRLSWPSNLCNGSGVPENIAWYSFIAGDSLVYISIEPLEFSVASGNTELQAGVYDFCKDDNGKCLNGNSSCANGQNPVEFLVKDLSIGQVYYLYVDGCNGSQCKFNIRMEAPLNNQEEETCPSEMLTFNYFFDGNENGVKDISEDFVNLNSLNEFILIEPQTVISNLSNNSEIHLVKEGTYNLAFINDIFLPTNMPTSIEVLNDQGNVNYEFGITVNNLSPLSISTLELTSSSIEVCNTSVIFSYEITNSGNQLIDDEVTLLFNPLFQYIDADQNAISSTDSTVIWQTGNLLPLENTTINVRFDLPDESNTGKIFCLTPSSEFSSPDKNLPYCFELRCAFDPNDKHGIPFRGGENYTLFDETLKYTIRFENLGNFYAKNIRIEDKLSPNLNWSTFKLLQSSHEVDRYWINRNGELKLFFNEIQLPSIEMDSILNKGFVQFSIEQKPDLPENTIIENRAFIFFDNNTRIFTNKTSHKLVSKLPILDYTNEWEITNDLLIYPNPGSSILYIDSSIDLYDLKSIRILNTKGQSIIQHDLESHSINVESLDKGLYIVESTSRNGKIRIAKYIKL